MSAVTVSVPAGNTRPRTVAPSAAKLTAVELRKMTDTRAGAWLLGIVVLSSLALVVVQVFTGEAGERTLTGFFSMAQFGMSVLLPVVGILAITSEWSQRTALTTFALEPRRERVINAKLAAAVLLVVGLTAVSLAFAAVANAVAPSITDASGSWSIEAMDVVQAIVFQLAGMLVGLAFGLLLLSSPLAIVLYFVLPTAWTILGEAIAALETPARWLDLNSTTSPLVDGAMTGEAWAQLGTSLALWFVLPLVLGLVRVMRAEVK